MSTNSRKGPIVDPGLCRCCGTLKKCRLLNVEYEWFGQKEVYSEMFVECFGLLLSHLEGEESERVICATCVVRLRDARAFRQQVLLCEEKLLNANIQVHGDGVPEDMKNKMVVKVELEELTADDKVLDDAQEQVDMNEGDDDAGDHGDDNGDDADYDAESLRSEPSPEPVRKSHRKKKLKSKAKGSKRKKTTNGQCDERKISKRTRSQDCQYLEEIDSTRPEIHVETENASDNLLSTKSKEKYISAYENFIQWRKAKSEDQSLSEDVFLDYFKELNRKYKPSTLWCIFSMIKSIISAKYGLDIKTYQNLTEYIRKSADGFIGKKSNTLSQNEVEKFLKEAPDSQYLATKVALIFGISGACGSQDLLNITTKDIENHGKMLLVKVTNTKSKIPRSFVIRGPFYDIVKKYEALRSTKAKNSRFFQNYQKGKCTCQPIGVNKFGNMAREIAKFLGLPDADSYTAHSFRRTSATLLVDPGADVVSLKSQDRESLNDGDLIQNETKDSADINIEINSKQLSSEPSTSNNNILLES